MTTKRREPCQVGSGTDHPCSRWPMVKIRGVPFCETCAREQEAYFAVGQLVTHAHVTQAQGRGLDWELARLVAEAGER